MKKNYVIVIAGPTASGKTSLAIDIAKRKNAEIISADSMQIYKRMDIASAKPTPLERSQAVHHLIDFIEPDEDFSVAKYKKAAYEKIEDIISRKKNPIIAGGTGLYIDAVIKNTQFFDYEENIARQQLEMKCEKDGIEALYNELLEVDESAAKRLHINDKKRIIRALEVYRLTGKTLSEQNDMSHLEKSPYDFLLIGLDAHNRQFLYDRINKRVDIMLEQGLLEEAKDFFSNEFSFTAKQAIGYKELKPYLDGEVTLEQATENLKMQTRRYAKRQLTWFRRYSNMNMIYIDQGNPTKKCLEIIENYENTE